MEGIWYLANTEVCINDVGCTSRGVLLSTHCTVRKALLFRINSEESIARCPLLTKSEQDAISEAQSPIRQVQEIIVIDDNIESHHCVLPGIHRSNNRGDRRK
uniref:Uncharacterized protein n=1 Tax=Glossina austeni TaxID=7395 RepID=A0A1A9V013_GLOAU